MTLSILLWLPLAAALIAALLPAKAAPRVALLGSLATLGVAISFLARFDMATSGRLQFVTDREWIPQLGLHYKLGIDGLNLSLVVATAFLFAVALIAANLRDWDRSKVFYFHLGLAESGVLGAFLAQDVVLFVAFFDLMFIPFYFLCGSWGSGDRVRATTKLVIYTLVGSLFMLAGAVALGIIAAGSYDRPVTFVISELQRLPVGQGTQEWIFLCFAAAFLIKMPSFPFHGWMPDTYRSMPLPALAVFSALLSKVAAYGFLRIVLPVLPGASTHFQELMLLIALASILYGSVMAFTTTEMRLVLGYSSVAQLGFILLGAFALRGDGAQGALLQMLNHALVVVPLLLIVGLCAARAGGSEDLRDMGGIATRAPVLAAMFLILALATLAMPGSANFVGEFLILLGVFKAKVVIAVVAFAGVIMASVYMLRVYIRSMHNRAGESVRSREFGWGDAAAIVPVVAVVLFLAVYPQWALERSERSAAGSVAAVRGAPERPFPKPGAAPAQLIGRAP